MKNHTICMTDEEWEKLQIMGGSAWIRDRIAEEDIAIWENEKQEAAEWAKEKSKEQVWIINLT